MKKPALGLLALFVAAAILIFTPARALLVAMTIPGYPEWPTPQQTLGADDSGEIYFPTSSPYDLEVILADMESARPATGIGWLSYPEPLQPGQQVPAMVIVHGSGGIAPGREMEYARFFNQLGIAAFVIDYYAPRGFDEDSAYLIKTSAVTEFDLIADTYASLRLLASSPHIDSSKIGVIGFSYGGMAARLAADSRIQSALSKEDLQFALHIDVYGPCFQDLQSDSVTGAPILTLRGTEDASNELPACAKREEELRELGVDVEAHIYEGVGHAWENTAPRAMKEDAPYLSGCELSYDQRGKPYLNGELLNDYAIDASHAVKMAARFSSSTKFRDCVGYGYIIGRDETAREQGYRDITDFVQKHF